MSQLLIPVKAPSTLEAVVYRPIDYPETERIFGGYYETARIDLMEDGGSGETIISLAVMVPERIGRWKRNATASRLFGKELYGPALVGNYESNDDGEPLPLPNWVVDYLVREMLGGADGALF